MNATTIFLVIQIAFLADHSTVTLDDSEQPDIATCMARATDALERAAKVPATKDQGQVEFFATCSVVSVPDDPA